MKVPKRHGYAVIMMPAKPAAPGLASVVNARPLMSVFRHKQRKGGNAAGRPLMADPVKQVPVQTVHVATP